MRTLAIIPAFNEEASIVNTVNALKEAATSIDYIIINDGSTDSTRELCDEHGFNCINLPYNTGLASAFQVGMKYAQRNNYDAALQFDADGQHLPNYCESMIATMADTGADIVIGSRFVNKQKRVSARMFGSSLISGFIKLTTGKLISDPTSGMRLYNKYIIDMFSSGHDIAPEPDTLAYCLRKGAQVYEVPVEMNERLAGESYLNFSKSIVYMLRTCISILILQWFR